MLITSLLLLGQVLCFGDSLTHGYSKAVPYPAQLVAPFAVENLGTLGETARNLRGVATLYADVAFGPDAQQHLAIIWIGSNDLASWRDARKILTDVATMSCALRSRGWKIIVLTVIARCDARGVSRYNVLLRERWPTFADALVDVAADRRLSSCRDRRYYLPDGIHLTTTGYAIVAAKVSKAINEDNGRRHQP
jgi:lysophospholipase L1-like esterase